MGRAQGLVVLAAWVLTCGSDAPAPPQEIAWRAVEPAPGTVSLADVPRVEIAGETRPVLGTQPLLALRWREPVVLAEELRVAAELPSGLPPGTLVSIDTWVSVRTPDADAAAPQRGGLAGELARIHQVGRRVLGTGPVLRAANAPGGATIAVPSELQGQAGLLSTLARPLPETARVAWMTQPLDVPPGARLGFGYGIEEEGWGEGWPAVRFRVSAVAPGERDVVVFEAELDPARRAEQRRWHDAQVGLEARAGRSVRLRFEAEALERSAGEHAPRSLAVFASPELRVPVSAARRNVVLVSLDTLRTRSVSAYGSARKTTPALDRELVANGALMKQAVAPFAFTPPSHMTMLTGLEPCMHGVMGHKGVLPANQVTLAEQLRAAGYRTAAFTENGYVSASAGFARGFDVYNERRDERHAAPGYGAETFRRAAAWVESAADRPFFLFVHTYEVHTPYEPPSEYAELFRDDGVTAGARKPHREHLRQYEREVRYTDDLLAAFLSALEEQGLAADTIVVVTSDHGEAFGEHLAVGHGYDTYDETVLVPLVVRAPGLVPPGTVVAEQVGLVDLVPTLLELVGVDAPPEIPGRSFAGLLRGGTSNFEERPIFIHTAIPGHVAIRTGRYKYIERSPERFTLHQLDVDPLERRNADDGAVLAEARQALARSREACREWVRVHPPAASPEDVDRRAPGWLVNRDELDAQLRALGYAE